MSMKGMLFLYFCLRYIWYTARCALNCANVLRIKLSFDVSKNFEVIMP